MWSVWSAVRRLRVTSRGRRARATDCRSAFLETAPSPSGSTTSTISTTSRPGPRWRTWASSASSGSHPPRPCRCHVGHRPGEPPPQDRRPRGRRDSLAAMDALGQSPGGLCQRRSHSNIRAPRLPRLSFGIPRCGQPRPSIRKYFPRQWVRSSLDAPVPRGGISSESPPTRDGRTHSRSLRSSPGASERRRYRYAASHSVGPCLFPHCVHSNRPIESIATLNVRQFPQSQSYRSSSR